MSLKSCHETNQQEEKMDDDRQRGPRPTQLVGHTMWMRGRELMASGVMRDVWLCFPESPVMQHRVMSIEHQQQQQLLGDVIWDSICSRTNNLRTEVKKRCVVKEFRFHGWSIVS